MGKLPSLKMLLVATVISLGGSFHFGFQLCVTNPAQESLMQFLNKSHESHYGWGLEDTMAKSVWSVIIATFSIGAIFGSLPIGYVSSRIGRKRGLYISFGLTGFSCVLSIISFHVFSFELYIVSRIIIGFSLSMSLGLAAVFLSESSPKECRGAVSTMTCIFSTAGSVVAVVIGMTSILGTQNLWWYLFVTEAILLVLVLAVIPLLPESPSYLLLLGREVEAKKAVLFFHECGNEEADEKLLEIKENLKLSAKTMSVIDVVKDHYSLKGTLVGIAISSAVCFSGNSIMNAYAVTILVETGLSQQNAAYGNIGLTAVLLISSGLSSFIVERLGRRPLVLLSNGVIVVLNVVIFALMLCFEKYGATWIGFTLIAVIAISQFFYAAGIGPLCFFISAEMVCQAARGIAQSAATLSQMASRAVVLAVFLPLSQAVGQAIAYMILSIVPMIISFIFLFFNLPETKNRTYKEPKTEYRMTIYCLPALEQMYRNALPEHLDLNLYRYKFWAKQFWEEKFRFLWALVKW